MYRKRDIQIFLIIFGLIVLPVLSSANTLQQSTFRLSHQSSIGKLEDYHAMGLYSNDSLPSLRDVIIVVKSNLTHGTIEVYGNTNMSARLLGKDIDKSLSEAGWADTELYWSDDDFYSCVKGEWHTPHLGARTLSTTIPITQFIQNMRGKGYNAKIILGTAAYVSVNPQIPLIHYDNYQWIRSSELQNVQTVTLSGSVNRSVYFALVYFISIPFVILLCFNYANAMAKKRIRKGPAYKGQYKEATIILGFLYAFITIYIYAKIPMQAAGDIWLGDSTAFFRISLNILLFAFIACVAFQKILSRTYPQNLNKRTIGEVLKEKNVATRIAEYLAPRIPGYYLLINFLHAKHPFTYQIDFIADSISFLFYSIVAITCYSLLQLLIKKAVNSHSKCLFTREDRALDEIAGRIAERLRLSTPRIQLETTQAGMQTAYAYWNIENTLVVSQCLKDNLAPKELDFVLASEMLANASRKREWIPQEHLGIILCIVSGITILQPYLYIFPQYIPYYLQSVCAILAIDLMIYLGYAFSYRSSIQYHADRKALEYPYDISIAESALKKLEGYSPSKYYPNSTDTLPLPATPQYEDSYLVQRRMRLLEQSGNRVTA